MGGASEVQPRPVKGALAPAPSSAARSGVAVLGRSHAPGWHHGPWPGGCRVEHGRVHDELGPRSVGRAQPASAPTHACPSHCPGHAGNSSGCREPSSRQTGLASVKNGRRCDDAGAASNRSCPRDRRLDDVGDPLGTRTRVPPCVHRPSGRATLQHRPDAR